MKGWIANLADMEKLLQKDFERLNKISGGDESSVLLRSLLKKMIEVRVKGIELTLKDYLCGRNTFEKEIMEYQIRIGLPLFSHLQRILNIESTVEDIVNEDDFSRPSKAIVSLVSEKVE